MDNAKMGDVLLMDHESDRWIMTSQHKSYCTSNAVIMQ